jgi:hypothetical protein
MKKWYGAAGRTDSTATPRVNASEFPMDWKSSPALGEAPKIEMTEPMGPRLPRVKITVHSAKNLEKKSYFKIRMCLVFTTFTVKKLATLLLVKPLWPRQPPFGTKSS